MNQLIQTINNQPMTSSLVIAEQFDREHKNVIQSIDNLVSDGVIGGLDFKPTSYTDKSNRQSKMYELTERGFLIAMPFIGGSKAKQGQATLVDAFLAYRQQAPAMPQSLPEALRLAAQLAEERDNAIATKAEIGSRREASAMGTASAAVSKVSKLEIELDQSQQYCTVKRMQMIHHGQKFNWRLLKSTATEMQLPPKDVFDSNYGTVKAYHISVWKEAYALTIDQETAA